MPQLTVEELILADVVETLRGIGPPAYRNTFTVEQESVSGNSPKNNLLVVLAGDTIPQDADVPLGMDEFLLPVGIVGYAIQSEDSTTAIRSRLSSIAADVRTALQADIYRGALAYDTFFDREHPDQFFTDAAPCSVLVTAMVRYRTVHGDAYDTD